MSNGLNSFNLSSSLASIKVGKRLLWSMSYEGDMFSFWPLKLRFWISFHQALYHEDEDFKEVVEIPSNFGSFTLQDGFFFNGNKLYIPKSLVRDLIVKKAHGGALAGHFGSNKTLEILKEHFIGLRWVGMFMR